MSLFDKIKKTETLRQHLKKFYLELKGSPKEWSLREKEIWCRYKYNRKMENWVSVPYFPNWMISDKGVAVKFHKSGPTIYEAKNQNTYVKINLTYNKYCLNTELHRLIAEIFIGKIPKGYIINHKDLNKSNNSLNNLEIITQGENVNHARVHALSRYNYVPRREVYATCYNKIYSSISQAACQTGIHYERVWAMCEGLAPAFQDVRFFYLDELML